MITKRQKLLISYYLFRCIFLGVGFSIIFDKTHQDSLISVIIGSIIGYFIIKLFKKLLNVKNGYSLKENIENFRFSKIIKLLFISFSIVFILIVLTILNNFISSFFLLNSPPFFIVIIFLIVPSVLAIRGLNNIAKTAEIIFFPSFIIPIIVIITLLKYIDISNLLPLFTSKASTILISALCYSIYSTAPYIFLLNIKNDGIDLDKFYIFNTILLFFIFCIIMLILGRNLTNIYRFPEYVVLKRIKIFSFIEKIENIVSCVWLSDEVIAISLALYTIYDLINNNKKAFLFIILFIFTVEVLIITSNYVNSLIVYYNAIYILSFALILVLIMLFANKKDGSNPS